MGADETESGTFSAGLRCAPSTDGTPETCAGDSPHRAGLAPGQLKLIFDESPRSIFANSGPKSNALREISHPASRLILSVSPSWILERCSGKAREEVLPANIPFSPAPAIERQRAEDFQSSAQVDSSSIARLEKSASLAEHVVKTRHSYIFVEYKKET